LRDKKGFDVIRVNKKSWGYNRDCPTSFEHFGMNRTLASTVSAVMLLHENMRNTSS